MPIWHVAWLWRRAVRGIFLDLIDIWSSAHSCLACYTVINPSLLETGRRRILFSSVQNSTPVSSDCDKTSCLKTAS